MIRQAVISAAVAAAALTAAPASAATLDGASSTSALALSAGGVRYRAFATSAAQEEVYLGRSDLGVGANRVAQNLTWGTRNDFSFSYDAATDTLSSAINGAPALQFANFTGGLSSAFSGVALDLLQIQIRDGAIGAGDISLSDLMLNGVQLTPNTVSAPESQINYWRIGGDFRQSFTLTGSLNLAGAFGTSTELNRVEFLVGNAVPEPSTWAMMIGGFGIAGAAMRRRAQVKVAFG